MMERSSKKGGKLCEQKSGPTGHTLVESTLFPSHFNEITLTQRGIDVELTSVPSGLSWLSCCVCVCWVPVCVC